MRGAVLFDGEDQHMRRPVLVDQPFDASDRRRTRACYVDIGMRNVYRKVARSFPIQLPFDVIRQNTIVHRTAWGAELDGPLRPYFDRGGV